MSDFKPFEKITFLNTGILEITPTTVYNETLLNTPIWLTVKSSPIWEVKVDAANGSSPDYKSIIPFGNGIDLGELIFGRIESMANLSISTKKKGQGTENQSIAEDAGFYMMLIGKSGTIGTDDLRNGKTNINVFLMEGKRIYLNLVDNGSTGADYSLEVGYEKLPE